MMGIVMFLIIGGVAGWLAGTLMKGGGFVCLVISLLAHWRGIRRFCVWLAEHNNRWNNRLTYHGNYWRCHIAVIVGIVKKS